MLDRRLAHVVAVAESGSFTRAAEKVGITQSGLTKSIADLENQLGYALFYRTPRGTTQTEAGREFVEGANRLLEDSRALLAGNKAGVDPFAYPLRIGVCPASLEWLLIAPLNALLKRHPTMRFELVAATFERVVQLLRHGTLDVALGFDDAFAEWTEIKRVYVATLRGVAFVRKDHPILEVQEITKPVLASYPFIAPSDSRPYGAKIREIFADAGHAALHSNVHTIDYFPLVQRIVASSDAIGVTTEEYARSPSFAETFRRVPGESIFPPAPMCIAVRSRWEPPITVRAFSQVLKDELRWGG